MQLPAIKRYQSSTGVRIYRIPCSVMPEFSGRVHLLLGAGAPTLVDAGSGRGPSTQQILDGLESLRRDFGEPFHVADLRRIIITHAHVDHIGGLAEILQHAQAEVCVHPLDSRALAAFDEYSVMGERQLRAFFCRAGVAAELHASLVHTFGLVPGRVHSVAVDRRLNEGDELDGLRIIHTPGHAPGHVCIAVGDILLSADHILPTTIPQQWPESTWPYLGLGHYLESLRKIAAMDGFTLALGGHEGPIRDIPQRIRQIEETQLRRLDRLLDLLRHSSEPLTVDQIATRMYTENRGFRAMLALMDAGARVEYFYQRGYLAVANLDEIRSGADAACRYRLA